MRILFLLAHYHDAAQVHCFIERVVAQAGKQPCSVEFAICDNSLDFSEDGLDPHADATVSVPEKNLGYLNGCAYAYRNWQAVRQGGYPDYIVVANTDLDLAGDFLERLLALRVSNRVGLIAPLVLDDRGGRAIFLERRPSRRRMMLYSIIYRNAVLMTLLLRMRTLKTWMEGRRSALGRKGIAEGSRDIYSPAGSLMILTARYQANGLVLEYPSFMYGEEIHLAEQCRRAGLTVRLEPGLRAVHHEHASTGKQSRGRRRRWKQCSNDFLLREYFSGASGAER